MFRKDLKVLRTVAIASVVAVGQLGASLSVANASDPILETGKAMWKSTSDFFSNLQLASAPSTQLASGQYSQSASGNTGPYVGVNYVNANKI